MKKMILLQLALVVAAWTGIVSAQTNGCFLSASNFESWLSKSQFYRYSEDQRLNSSLGKALVRMSQSFEVEPGFAFYRGAKSDNAVAIKAQLTIEGYSRRDGLIALGSELLERLKSGDDEGISLLAVLAHEFAHIYQYQNNIEDVLRENGRVKLLELHADYLAGFYLGMLKRRVPGAKMWYSGRLFDELGDYEFNEKSHHGTPEERVSALEAGYFGVINKNITALSQVNKNGIKYVKKNFSG